MTELSKEELEKTAQMDISLREKFKLLGLGKNSYNKYYELLDKHGIPYETKQLRPPPSKKTIKRLYYNPDLTIKQMAELAGCSVRSFHNYVDKFKLKRKRPQQRISSKLYREITNDYFQLLAPRSISQKHHMADYRVRDILKSLGFHLFKPSERSRLKTHVMGEFWVMMSSEFVQIVEGLMLGDGNLRNNADKKQRSTNISLSDYRNAREELLFLRESWQHIDFDTAVDRFNEAARIINSALTAFVRMDKALLEEGWLQSVGAALQHDGYSVKITPNKKGQLDFVGQSTVQLYYLYLRWYPNGKKRLPNDMQLTPLTVLFWFTGDGSFRENNSICLSSHNFSKTENEFLASLLEEQVGIKAHVYPSRSSADSEKTLYHLEITHTDNIKRFFKYLEQAPRSYFQLAKQSFPWKFNRYLLRRDVKSNRASVSS
ncbi:MAG: LAGLIDADG family homing endonuclease [Promethearchaeota archaeon]